MKEMRRTPASALKLSRVSSEGIRLYNIFKGIVFDNNMHVNKWMKYIGMQYAKLIRRQISNQNTSKRSS
ncbi:hypothetical protein Y032_0009g479 [Ancylostoma ceylanicum]|uniref:Uncharacterized protein n=1 Tax=Ancylostoma ceylanicum TaxID=53326 RepID=A0A016VIE1_9BILA|nr:hypothetical protein Y032_0009g479 [Ancylostoma ceylanicum]